MSKQPGLKVWASLWWGHVWRYFWRGLVLLVIGVVALTVAGALFKLLRLPEWLMLVVVMPVFVAAFLWWCFKNYIYALDAMMRPGLSFGGYQLKFVPGEMGEDTVTERLRAMRWLSWGMIWRNGLWAIPVAIADELYSRFALPALLPPYPSSLDVLLFAAPFSAVALLLYALIWTHVLKGRLGKDVKGYTLQLVPDMAMPVADAAKAPAPQPQWGGKS